MYGAKESERCQALIIRGNSKRQEVTRWPKYYRKVGWQKIDLRYKWAYQNLTILGENIQFYVVALKWSILPQIYCGKEKKTFVIHPRFLFLDLQVTTFITSDGNRRRNVFLYIFSLKQSPTFALKFDYFYEFLT